VHRHRSLHVSWSQGPLRRRGFLTEKAHGDVHCSGRMNCGVSKTERNRHFIYGRSLPNSASVAPPICGMTTSVHDHSMNRALYASRWSAVGAVFRFQIRCSIQARNSRGDLGLPLILRQRIVSQPSKLSIRQRTQGKLGHDLCIPLPGVNLEGGSHAGCGVQPNEAPVLLHDP